MKYEKLSKLKVLSNNPRKITEEDLAILKESISKNKLYFEARPLILSDRTGELVIIAGNQRYLAARGLGLKEVPTFLISNLTEEQEREIIIRDNVSNGEWDFEKLKEWDSIELGEWGLEVSGFETPLADLTDFKPSLEPSTNYSDVTKEEIHKEAKRLADKMFREQVTRDVICPDCGHEFSIEK
jgi:ParB-like chromosome segregation protein Spo0J